MRQPWLPIRRNSKEIRRSGQTTGEEKGKSRRSPSHQVDAAAAMYAIGIAPALRIYRSLCTLVRTAIAPSGDCTPTDHGLPRPILSKMREIIYIGRNIVISIKRIGTIKGRIITRARTSMPSARPFRGELGSFSVRIRLSKFIIFQVFLRYTHFTFLS